MVRNATVLLTKGSEVNPTIPQAMEIRSTRLRPRFLTNRVDTVRTNNVKIALLNSSHPTVEGVTPLETAQAGIKVIKTSWDETTIALANMTPQVRLSRSSP
jgi:hypothetical protein